MVDFKRKLGVTTIEKEIDPIKIYDGLDRASDKGPLRPIQQELLEKWIDKFANNKDVILKLHTGQGKTIVGLIILQSKLNQNCGPAVYLCPDKYLVKQTCKQAESFGIQYVTAEEGDLPFEFLNGDKILITTASKMFNGGSKFGLGTRSEKIGAIVLDDAHSCMEYIKKSYTVIIEKSENIYDQIMALFETELDKQGSGTLQDIKGEDPDSFLVVPYWDWETKHAEIVKLLGEKKDELLSIKFAWPIIKDNIKNCRCIISGDRIEITLLSSPISIFGAYYNAKHRVFMSATVNNDAFFIKGLGVDCKTILEPLCIDEEKWSGEKMILIPSIISDKLTRTEMLKKFAVPNNKRKVGYVAITPSFNKCKDWEIFGSTVAKKETLYSKIEDLKAGNCENTLVIANRYDGVDLPDNTCRILILDSKPCGTTLEERYYEECRGNSEYVFIKTSQTIEQGLGRGVRGEKDYCAIVIVGNELVRTLRSKDTKKYFSPQTTKQVDIGIELAEFAQDEISSGQEPLIAFLQLIKQLLTRDEGWKEFYVERMSSLEKVNKNQDILKILELENKAEEYYLNQRPEMAIDVIQSIIDKYSIEKEEKGWYLQEMARYTYSFNKIESNKYQISAHDYNPNILKPKDGIVITKMTNIAFKRVENIIKKVKNFGSYEELMLGVSTIIDQLYFGNDSKKFEKAFDELGKILGFECQRPDNLWNEGPDNLWKLDDQKYLLVECKNMVLAERKEIYKLETGQMNNACAWFSEQYNRAADKNIMIIPTNKLGKAAGFNLKVEIMTQKNLNLLIKNVECFFKELHNFDFNNISEERLHALIKHYRLTVDDLLNIYSISTK